MSLCGEKNRPCSHQLAWNVEGNLVPCGDCREIAKAIIEWIIGEPIEFFGGRWVTTRYVDSLVCMIRGSACDAP